MISDREPKLGRILFALGILAGLALAAVQYAQMIAGYDDSSGAIDETEMHKMLKGPRP
jgi:hypothetical protein